MAAEGVELTVEALVYSTNICVLRSYAAEGFANLEELGKRLLSDLVALAILTPDTANTASIGFYNYQVGPCNQFLHTSHQCVSSPGQALDAAPAIHKRLDDQIPNAPLAISARQNRDAHERASITPLLARIVLPGAEPGFAVGVTLLSPGEEAQHMQMLVCASTTVGDVRQLVRKTQGVPFGRQRWLSLQRTILQQRRSSDSISAQSAPQYDTTYDMLLDDTRSLFSYGGITPGSEIHVAIEPAAPSGTVDEEHSVSATLPVPVPSDVAATGQHPNFNYCKTMAEVSCWASNGINARVPYGMFREGQAMVQAAASAAAGWRARA